MKFERRLRLGKTARDRHNFRTGDSDHRTSALRPRCPNGQFSAVGRRTRSSLSSCFSGDANEEVAHLAGARGLLKLLGPTRGDGARVIAQAHGVALDLDGEVAQASPRQASVNPVTSSSSALDRRLRGQDSPRATRGSPPRPFLAGRRTYRTCAGARGHRAAQTGRLRRAECFSRMARAECPRPFVKKQQEILYPVCHGRLGT